MLFGLSGRNVDILEFSRSKLTDVNLVCFRLTAARVRLKLDKCRLEQLEVEYLGQVITRGRIRPSPSSCVVAKRNTQHEKNDERSSERNHSQCEVITCSGSMNFNQGGDECNSDVIEVTYKRIL